VSLWSAGIHYRFGLPRSGFSIEVREGHHAQPAPIAMENKSRSAAIESGNEFPHSKYAFPNGSIDTLAHMERPSRHKTPCFSARRQRKTYVSLADG
jgi:hypothetical protein